MNPKTLARVLCLFLFLPLPILFCQNTDNNIVYVTNSGRAYHRETCSSLRASRIAVALGDAARTYNACSTCKPPTIDISSIPQSKAELYRVNLEGLTNSGAADIKRMLGADVVGHVDGDTIRVRIANPPEGLSVVETIRLLGVDTPEINHPMLPEQRLGQEASDFTRYRLLGSSVYLAFDWDLRDRYGRLLAYIYTGPGRCFNAELISEGYAAVYLRFPFQFMSEFEALGKNARQTGQR